MKHKILQLVTLSETGGAQKVVYYLAAGLDREKFDVTVACGPGGELVGWLKKLPAVKVIELDRLKREISPLKDVLCLLRLYHLFRCVFRSIRSPVPGFLARWSGCSDAGSG